MPTKRVNFHISESLLEELKELSEKTGISQSELFRRAVDAFLKKSREHPPKPRRV